MSRLDIDEIWAEFRRHVSDPAARKAMGWKLTNDADIASIYYSGYRVAADMADLDDLFYLQAHGLLYGHSVRTVDQVIEDLRFQVVENGLATDRAARLLALWRRQTGNPGIEERMAALLLHEKFLEVSLTTVRDEMTRLKDIGATPDF